MEPEGKKGEKGKGVKIKRLMGQHQEDQCLYYRGPRRIREKGEKHLLEQITAENILTWEIKMTSKSK